MSYKKRVVIFITIIIITFLALLVFFVLGLDSTFQSSGGEDLVPQEVKYDFRENIGY